MGKIKSFSLEPGTRIGNYKILEPLGRGWEGEVYEVEEVPTEARRALKILPKENFKSVRDIIHTAWFFEQLASTGSVARYYHMGQWFFQDDEGVYYLVFERLDGINLKEFLKHELDQKKCASLFLQICQKLCSIHNEGYAVGDFSNGENIIVINKNCTPIFCDLNSGKADRPNTNYKNDLEELGDLLKMFNYNFNEELYKKTRGLIKDFKAKNNSKILISKFTDNLSSLFENQGLIFSGI
jgi:serine/threonine protein kinase